MSEECCIKGCKNKLGFLEETFRIRHCEECERLLMTAKLEKIDISLYKDKEDLIKQLEGKLKNKINKK